MPVFTSKTSTNPGPFDALPPRTDGTPDRVNLVEGAQQIEAATAGQAGLQKKAHLGSSVTDEDSELDHLYRFQEIPVTAEMRRELLGAKLPLVAADQLADTQPPYKSGLSAPIGSVVVDRHAPTEPALVSPNHARENDLTKHERALLDHDSYSTTAPTLLSLRRRRLRNRRLVVAAVGAMMLAILLGVAWRRSTRPSASLARDSAADRVKTPHIAGNRPGSSAPISRPDKPAGDGHGTAALPRGASPLDRNEATKGSESANSDSQSAQLSLPVTDATSSSPPSADPELASRDSRRASSPLASSPAPARPSPAPARPSPAPARPSPASSPASAMDVRSSSSSLGNGKAESTTQPASKPAKSKAFDPEELIF